MRKELACIFLFVFLSFEAISQHEDGTEEVYQFNPAEWNIVEGKVDDATALENRYAFENALAFAKKNGKNTVKIARLDAYFDVATITRNLRTRFYPSLEAINIPSGICLQMSKEVHLRVQPNGAPKYSLLAVYDAENITIEGGNLHGDRDEHDYTKKSSHEWGHLINLHAARDIRIDGVTLRNGSGDGIDIHSLNFTFQDNYRPSKNITIQNCVFDSNRRNNLSITDGYDIVVENNVFLNAGIDTPKSKGTSPKHAIDVEAYRERNKKGELVRFEIVDGVIIRNNVEKGSAWGSFLVAIGDNVLMEENIVEGRMGYGYARGTRIFNNTIVGNGKVGLKAGEGTSETVQDNIVKGNRIKGFKFGMQVYGQQHLIYDNLIEDFETGLMLKNVSDSKIYDNQFRSAKKKSRGLMLHVTSVDNTEIAGNTFDVQGIPYLLSQVNTGAEDEGRNFVLSDNTFKSPQKGKIEKAVGLKFSQ